MFLMLILISALATSLQSRAADLKLTISTRTTLPTGRVVMDYTHTMLIHGERSRSSYDGRHTFGRHVAMIQQCDAHQMITLDLDNQVYSAYPTGWHTAEMKAALARAKANQPLPLKETLTISTQVVDTNERKTAFGRQLRHYRIHTSSVASPGANTQSSEEDVDGWFVEIPEYGQLHGCNPFDGEQRKGATGVVFGSSGPPNFRIVRGPPSGPPVPGYAADVTRTEKSFLKMPDGTQKVYTSTSIETIRELSTSPLDPALFDPPPNYARVANVETGQPSWQYRLQIAWAKFKREFLPWLV